LDVENPRPIVIRDDVARVRCNLLPAPAPAHPQHARSRRAFGVVELVAMTDMFTRARARLKLTTGKGDDG
jgi:hypothetical protein